MKKDLIYRGERYYQLGSSNENSISDIEVIHKDVQGAFYHMRYPLS